MNNGEFKIIERTISKSHEVTRVWDGIHGFVNKLDGREAACRSFFGLFIRLKGKRPDSAINQPRSLFRGDVQPLRLCQRATANQQPTIKGEVSPDWSLLAPSLHFFCHSQPPSGSCVARPFANEVSDTPLTPWQALRLDPLHGHSAPRFPFQTSGSLAAPPSSPS